VYSICKCKRPISYSGECNCKGKGLYLTVESVYVNVSVLYPTVESVNINVCILQKRVYM
jgi:hypothetical protein